MSSGNFIGTNIALLGEEHWPIYKWRQVRSKRKGAIREDGPLVAEVVFWEEFRLGARNRRSVFFYHERSGNILLEMSTGSTPSVFGWDEEVELFEKVRGDTLDVRLFWRRLAGFLLDTGCPAGAAVLDDVEVDAHPVLNSGERPIYGSSLLPSSEELQVMKIIGETSPIWWRNSGESLDWFRERSPSSDG